MNAKLEKLVNEIALAHGPTIQDCFTEAGAIKATREALAELVRKIESEFPVDPVT